MYFQKNLDAVFLIYGLAFLVMGAVILVQPREKSEFAIANILWLLALFGITHGANELMDMWAIIKGRHHIADVIRWFMLVISFVFLFEFGRELFRLAVSDANLLCKKISRQLGWWLTPLIIIIILTAGFMSSDFWTTGTIWARYLLCFPGGILVSSGLFLYYKLEIKILNPLGVKKYFNLICVSFFFYGILGGLIVPKGLFFPSNYINTDSFANMIHIPVQLFRALCAITVAWGVSGILKIFNWEIRTKLEEAQLMLKEQLKETEKSYMEVVENSSDMIYFIDTEKHIRSANKQGYDFPGFLKTELTGKPFNELYASELWKDMENCLERLKQEGSFVIERGNIIKKDGEKLDVSIHLVAVYDIAKNYTGARVIIRDISRKVKLGELQMKKVKELEEFYEMAVGRELKMLELKEEIDKLNRKLQNKNP